MHLRIAGRIVACVTLLTATRWFAQAQPPAGADREPSPLTFDEWLRESRKLETQRKAAWERYTAAPHFTPEKEALLAEVQRLDRAQGVLNVRHRPPEGAVAEDKAAELKAGPRPLARLPGTNGTAVAFSAAGLRLLVAGGDEARVWDARPFGPLGDVMSHAPGIWVSSFSPDGTKVLTAGAQSVRLWDVASAKLLHELGHPSRVRCAAFSRDGKRIASGCGDKRVRLWDVDTGKPVETKSSMEHANEVRFVAFAPAGDVVFAADTWRRPRIMRKAEDPPNGTSLRAWDAASGEARWAYMTTRPGSAVSEGALAPDGRSLVAIDENWRRIELIDAQTGDVRVRFDKAEGPEIVRPAFSLDGSLVAIGGWGFVELWDPATGKRVGDRIGGDVQDWVSQIAFSPDGKRLLVCARSGRYGIDSQLSGVWDVATRAKVLSLPYGNVQSGAFSPDGARVAVGAELRNGFETTVWDVPGPGVVVAKADDARATIPGRVPEPHDPEWHEVFDMLERSGLPRDLPLPAETPFDANAAQRLDYHNGYRLGFVAGLVNGYVEEDDDLRPRSDAFRRGYADGQVPGYRVSTLRTNAAKARRLNYRRGKLLSDESAEGEERKVLRSFRAFAAGFEKALRDSFPDTVTVDVVGVPRLYVYPVDDYSHDNTGTPRRVRHYTGVLDSRRPGNFEWMWVKPKDSDNAGLPASEVQGRYAFYFDYDAAADAWSLEREPYSPHPDKFDYKHFQRLEGVGEVWQGRDFSSVRAVVLAAVDQAQPGKPRALRVPSVTSHVPRPGELGRPWQARLRGPAGAFLGFSADGARLLTGDWKTAQVWDARTFQPVGAPLGHAKWMHAVAFSPDGTRVATGHDEGVARVWEAGAEPAKLLLELRHPEPGEDTDHDDVSALAWSPDGRLLLTGCTHTAQLWDASTGKVGLLLHHDQPFLAAMFSPDGKAIVTVTHNAHTRRDVGTGDPVSVRGLETGTGRLLWRKDSDYPGTPAVAMTPDGARVYAVLYVREAGQARGVERLLSWDTRTGRELLSAGVKQDLGSHARVHGFTQDGTKLLMSGSDATGVVDAATGGWLSVPVEGDPLWQWESPASAAMTPDGTRVAATSGSSGAAVWDPATGKILLDLTGRYVRSPPTRPIVAISPDGTLVVVSYGREGQTAVWKVPRTEN